MMFLAGLAGCGRSDAPGQGSTPAAASVEVPEYRSKALPEYDVVIVAIDGLRADRFTPELMPALSELAANGLRFDNATANSSYVLQSLASFFTGRLPTAGGTIGAYEAEPHDETRTLAQHFADAGYYTGLLANHPAIQGTGFTKGFEEIEIARADQPLDDARLVKRTTEFLEDAGDDRVFLFVHLAGVLASPLYAATPSSEADAPLSVAQLAADYSTAYPPPVGRVDVTQKAYNDAMTAADARLGELVAAVAAAGRAEKTLFVVTSLTGFELFEHGSLATGWTVYEESIHVPLVLHAPGTLPAGSSAGSVSLVDMLPTLLTLTGIDVGEAPREGRSLFAPDEGGLRLVRPDVPRIAEVVIPERCIVRSATIGNWKYIVSSLWTEPAARHAIAQTHKDTANAFADGSKPLPPMWGGAVEALFDLESDPGETRNLLEGDAPKLEDLRAALESYRAYCAEKGIAPRMATQFEAVMDEEQLQNLESLGYL